MAKFEPLIDRFGPLANRGAARDGELFGLAVAKSQTPSFVFSSQKGKQGPGFLVDELIDRFVADAESRTIEADPSGNLFWGPGDF